MVIYLDMASGGEARVFGWEVVSSRGRGEVVLALALVETFLAREALPVSISGLGRARMRWREESQGKGVSR